MQLNHLKNYSEMKSKEFFQKWKQGIKNVPLLKQTQIQIRSHWIILFGIFLGIVVSFFNLKNLFWLTIILTGAFCNTAITLVGLKQKEEQLKLYDSIIKIEGVKVMNLARLKKDKKAQMIDTDVFQSMGFWVLLGIGYLVIAIIIFYLKAVKMTNIMPWWVKILLFLIIPVVAYFFALREQ